MPSSLQPSSSVRTASPWRFTPACSAAKSSSHGASWSATPRIITRMFWRGRSISARTVTSPPTRRPASTTTWRCMLWAARPLLSVKCVARSSTSRRHCSLTDCSTTTESPRTSLRLPLRRRRPPRCTNASSVTMKLPSKGCSIATCWLSTAKASPTSAWNAAKVSDTRQSWRNTCARTRARNPTPVFTATTSRQIPPISKHTSRLSIAKRCRTNASAVSRPSPKRRS